ncbi:MAG TPA: hypothetical protein VIJ86_02225 [Acidimicrobiales bacterium]
MGLRAMWFSSVATVLGAIMYWVLTYQDTGIDLTIVGIVFMIAGATSFVISSVIFFASLRSPDTARLTTPRLALNSESLSGAVREDSQ